LIVRGHCIIVANPCRECIVRAACHNPCQEFEDYLNDTIYNTMPPGHIGINIDVLSRRLKRASRRETISISVAIQRPDYHIKMHTLVLEDGNITQIIRGYSVWEVK